ncbi:hypothetical protein, partial [Paractinoplanes deccanensis]
MRLFRTILGMLLLAIGLPSLLAGAALWAAMQHRDQGGAFSGDLQRLSTAGYAFVVPDVDRLLRDDAPFTRIGDAQLRVLAETQDGPAFVGLAPTAAVQRYLAGVPFSTVRTVDIGTGALPVATGFNRGRTAPAQLPGRADFWTRSGLGQVSWTPGDVTGGPYSLVVMDPGAKPALQLTATAELRPGWLNSSTWGLLTLGTLLLMTGLITLAWPSRRREIVYVVEPSQVPDLMAAIGAPLPLTSPSRPGAHRPRTLADAQKRRAAALPPPLDWPPSGEPALAGAVPALAGSPLATPPGAGSAAASAPPSLAGSSAAGSPSALAGSPAAGSPSALAGSSAAGSPSAGSPSAFAGSAAAGSAQTRQPDASPTATTTIPARAARPSGQRTPAPGEPLSFIGAQSATGPVSLPLGDPPSVPEPLFGTRADRATRRRSTAPTDIPMFQASAVGAWVAETAPARAREAEAQAAARVAEAARRRAAAMEAAAQASAPSTPPDPAAPTAPADRAPAAPTASADLAQAAPAVSADLAPAAAHTSADFAQTDANGPAGLAEAASDDLPRPAFGPSAQTAQVEPDAPADRAQGDLSTPADRRQSAPSSTDLAHAAPADLAQREAAKAQSAPVAAPDRPSNAPRHGRPAGSKPSPHPSRSAAEAPASSVLADEAESGAEDRPARSAVPEDGASTPDGSAEAISVNAVAAAYAAGAADARAIRGDIKDTASDHEPVLADDSTSPYAHAQAGGHDRRAKDTRDREPRNEGRAAESGRDPRMASQRVSVVTGPKATDWSATGPRRTDAPRVGRQSAAPGRPSPSRRPTPAGFVPAGDAPENVPPSDRPHGPANVPAGPASRAQVSNSGGAAQRGGDSRAGRDVAAGGGAHPGSDVDRGIPVDPGVRGDSAVDVDAVLTADSPEPIEPSLPVRAMSSAAEPGPAAPGAVSATVRPGEPAAQAMGTRPTKTNSEPANTPSASGSRSAMGAGTEATGASQVPVSAFPPPSEVSAPPATLEGGGTPAGTTAPAPPRPTVPRPPSPSPSRPIVPSPSRPSPSRTEESAGIGGAQDTAGTTPALDHADARSMADTAPALDRTDA